MADYHSADIDGPTIPEEYVERIATSGLLGVENISPKLTRRVKVDDIDVVLTGILPANEVASKPVWQLEGMEGDAPTHVCTGKSGEHADARLQRSAVEALAKGECLLGANVSSQLGLRVGHMAKVEKARLKVVQVLAATGTVDDDRVFMHLHEMQDMLGTGRQVSAIEIMGCCNAISDGMLSKLRNVLPDTRVVGIAQIVSTQIETNRLMDRVSWGFLAIVLVVGGLSIGNFMWANVNQRRREIGILRMIGASRGRIVNVLLVKAVVLGMLGGVLGYAIGTITTVALGPSVLGLTIEPMATFLAWSAGLATFVAVLGSIVPAWLASRFDPSANLQEV
jgi:putative ABC transport system permease protein